MTIPNSVMTITNSTISITNIVITIFHFVMAINRSVMTIHNNHQSKSLFRPASLFVDVPPSVGASQKSILSNQQMLLINVVAYASVMKMITP